MLRIIAILLLSISIIPHAGAEIVLPRIIGNAMVLQQNEPVSIWGTAAAGEQIMVNFKGQTKKTIASVSGAWKVLLNPMEASAEPSSLTISGTNEIELKNILVGEVWLCSGQSNMEYTMRKNSKVRKPEVKGPNPVDELQYAHNPAIRIFLVNRKLQSRPDPQHEGWSIAQDSALRSFSAAAYFFAKELNRRLQVPVGMISAAIPGSAIEPWIPEAAFRATAYFKDKQVSNDPGKFYETMIRPLAPFTIKGVLWYQGETNCFLAETLSYTYKMQALITSWRELWDKPKLPVYYVQIAPYYYSKSEGKVHLTKQSLPEFREAQGAALKIPNTAMIVTTDLADDLNNIHPPFKWEIGRRLALLALKHSYGYKDLVSSGPVFKKMKIKRHKALLYFNSEGSGLVSKDGEPLSGFEIAGRDGTFYPAKAEIKHNRVWVYASQVSNPVAVRFAWDEAAQPNFYNKEGLPARPFRTNNPLVSQYSYNPIN